MALTKQYLKTKPQCKVRFQLSAEEANGAESICVAGDFNNWDPQASPMRHLKNGTFVLDVTLPVDAVVKFRYLADGKRWLNDPQADGYERCDFAQADNSLLNL